MLSEREGVTVATTRACAKCICLSCKHIGSESCPKYGNPCNVCEKGEFVVQCNSLRWL